MWRPLSSTLRRHISTSRIGNVTHVVIWNVISVVDLDAYLRSKCGRYGSGPLCMSRDSMMYMLPGWGRSNRRVGSNLSRGCWLRELPNLRSLFLTGVS